MNRLITGRLMAGRLKAELASVILDIPPVWGRIFKTADCLDPLNEQIKRQVATELGIPLQTVEAAMSEYQQSRRRARFR